MESITETMDYVNDDWFIRDKVSKAIDENYFALAKHILAKKVNYDNDFEKILECIDEFCHIEEEDWSGDEIDFAIQNIMIACAIQELIDDGKIVETKKGVLQWKKV